MSVQSEDVLLTWDDDKSQRSLAELARSAKQGEIITSHFCKQRGSKAPHYRKPREQPDTWLLQAPAGLVLQHVFGQAVLGHWQSFQPSRPWFDTQVGQITCLGKDPSHKRSYWWNVQIAKFSQFPEILSNLAIVRLHASTIFTQGVVCITEELCLRINIYLSERLV